MQHKSNPQLLQHKIWRYFSSNLLQPQLSFPTIITRTCLHQFQCLTAQNAFQLYASAHEITMI